MSSGVRVAGHFLVVQELRQVDGLAAPVLQVFEALEHEHRLSDLLTRPVALGSGGEGQKVKPGYSCLSYCAFYLLLLCNFVFVYFVF